MTDATTLTVGMRVRVDLPDIPANERQCDTGVITKIQLYFPRSPVHTYTLYTVRLDGPYIKPKNVFFQNITTIAVQREQLVPA